MGQHEPMAARALVRIGVALLLTAACLGAPPPASAQAPPKVVQRYEIVATLDLAAGRLDAVETLTLTNRGAGALEHIDLSVIPRALGYLDMSEPITVDGVEASTAWTTTTNLRIELPEPLEPRATAAAVIPFGLTVGTSESPYTARLSRENGVFSFGQWFPILSPEHDVHGIGDSQISFTAGRIGLDLTTTTDLPRDAVACPGLVVAPEEFGTRWTCEADDVRDFSFAVNPDYRLTSRIVGETTLRVYTETVSGEVTAEKAAVALAGLNDAFGEYPWPDLVIAEIGGGGGFSMEYPRAIHLTRTKVTDTYVIFHEVAHQWFYAQLGNDQMLEPWLDEGFADFSARHLMGIGENHCSTRAVDSSVFAWDAGPISGGDWTSCDGYFHAVFYRGTEFINAVRDAMGADEFFAAMREFIERYRHDLVTGSALLDHLQRRSDVDLQPLYRAYLTSYEPSAPDAGRRPRGGGSWRPL